MSDYRPSAGKEIPAGISFHKTLPFHSTRNPVRHTGRGFRAKFCSQKNRRMIRCESLLEMGFLHLAEFAKNVVTFEEQPVNISYRLHNRTRRYTPDFKMQWANGENWYVEVKPSTKLETEESQSKFAAIKDYFAAQGDTFITITEKQVQKCVQHEQVLNLLRIRGRFQFSTQSSSELTTLPTSSLTFENFSSHSGGILAAMHLLAARAFSFDLTTQLTNTTLIHQFKEEDDVALFI